MSKVFNQWYFSKENGYGDEDTYRRNQEAQYNAVWERYEQEQARKDLEKGIADNVPEFVWMEEETTR